MNQHIKILKNNQNSKNKYLKEYISFIEEKNNENKSVSKNIFLIIKCEEKNNSENFEENIFQELKEKYFKIKDNLSRCGNNVQECSKEESIEILFSIFNAQKFLNMKKEVKIL